jgi:acetyl-CoA carboxylase carboxyl transferase subunit alpha
MFAIHLSAPQADVTWAENIRLMMELRIPIITVIIGEGGSGGALGIGVGDLVYVMENAYYSVISPEGCAAFQSEDCSRVFQDCVSGL